MADVVIKLKIMPESVESDLNSLKDACKQEIERLGGHVHSIEEQPIAFGLKALIYTFLADEKIGSDMEKLESCLKEKVGIGSVDIIDVRRAFG